MRYIKSWGIIFSLMGILDSGYLSWIKFSHSEEKCIAGLGNCALVNTSAYSEIFKIPIAYFGLLAYLVIFMLMVSSGSTIMYASSIPFQLFGITLIGLLFSGYLTYVQFGILHAYCPYCLLSAVTTTCLFIISTIMMVKEINL
jgi:uncharacterized membrane protein